MDSFVAEYARQGKLCTASFLCVTPVFKIFLAGPVRVSEVRRQITAGRSDEIIIDQIRQKYGDYVLFNPPLDRGTLFLWLAPIGFVGLGVLIIVLARRNLHTLASPELGASDRARIEAMLVTRYSANSNEKGGHKE